MLECLEHWWNNGDEVNRHDRALELTIIRLMVSMMKKDNKLDMNEHDAVIRVLRKRFEISNEAAEHLFQEAKQADAEGPRYELLAQQIGSRHDWIDVATLLDDIWCVAEADGPVDYLEDHYVGRISNLLGMSSESLTESSRQRTAA